MIVDQISDMGKKEEKYVTATILERGTDEKRTALDFSKDPIFKLFYT